MTQFIARGLSFGYQRHRLLFSEVSVQPKPGEILVLLGANGAGKTTLLKILAGHLRPQSGDVLVDDLPIGRYGRQTLARRLAFMPQFEHRDCALSVRDVVRLGRSPHRGWWLPLNSEDERFVDEALAAMNLSELAEREVTGLSGGEWRRMIFARALAQNASILLLDEPTDGLDLKYQYECLAVLRRLVRRRQLVAVLTLHDLNQAAMFADRIALLGESRLLVVGTPEQVLTSEHIHRAFGISVTITTHPIYHTPMVVPHIDEGTGESLNSMPGRRGLA